MTVYLDSIFSRLATERLPWDALVWTESQQSVSKELERFKTFKNKLSRDLKFVFVIPVVSKKMAKDCGAVCQLLNNTLSALIAQSSPIGLPYYAGKINLRVYSMIQGLDLSRLKKTLFGTTVQICSIKCASLYIT